MIIWTWANLISFARLLILLIFLWNLWEGKKLFTLLLLLMFVGLDVLDGMVARGLNCVSEIGTVLDHGIDKFFGVTTLIVLYLKQWIPLWMLILYLLREIFLVLGWIMVRLKYKQVLRSRNFGKLAGGFYFLSVALAIMQAETFFKYFILVTLFLYYLAGVNYIMYFIKLRRRV